MRNLISFLVFQFGLQVFISGIASAQSVKDEFGHLLTTPRHYITPKVEKPPKIDGNLGEQEWQNAQWSDYFVDIEGSSKPLPAHNTRMKMVWDDSCLYIAAELIEPHIWATLKSRDAIIYHDNDFEVFIDTENNVHQYYEIEVNAYNTVLDLFMPKPYRNGGKALINWNLHKFRSAVRIDGTMNDPSDIDKGWTVEMAIPFSSISVGNHTIIPEEGSIWRINFSRVQWDVEVEEGDYVKKKDKQGRVLPEHNWVWSPQGVINMHYPERWGYLQFSESGNAEDKHRNFSLSLEEHQKQYLWMVYYKQKEYHKKEGKYADSKDTLALSPLLINDREHYKNMFIEAGTHQFIAIITGPDRRGWSIDQEGLIKPVKM